MSPEGLKTKKKRRREYESPAADEILTLLDDNPSTYEEIRDGTGKPLSAVYNLVHVLKKKNKARTVAIRYKRRTSSIIRSHELFGDMVRKSIVYLPGQEKQLGVKFIGYLPEELTPGKKRSLTRKLKRILPEEAFEVVHEYMLNYAGR